MNLKITILSILSLYGLCNYSLLGQETITSAGGNTTGSAGSVSYTVGQIIFSTFSGANGSVIQGVQQPYEISIATAIVKSDEQNENK